MSSAYIKGLPNNVLFDYLINSIVVQSLKEGFVEMDTEDIEDGRYLRIANKMKDINDKLCKREVFVKTQELKKEYKRRFETIEILKNKLMEYVEMFNPMEIYNYTTSKIVDYLVSLH